MAVRTNLETLRFEAADLSKDSAKVSNNRGVHQGKMVGFKLVMPNFVNPITATLSVVDSDGDVIYTSGNQAENGTRVVMGLDVPLEYGELVRIVLSGAHGGVAPDTFGDISFRLYYHPDGRPF